ncbi:MAG: tyrosine-type recombinase/integrase [Stellaceae bacterium]
MDQGQSRDRRTHGHESVALTDKTVRSLSNPEKGNKITYDGGPTAIRGFGARVTAGGVKSFVLNYTIAGRERRLTIGGYPAWTVAAARAEAKRLRQDVDRGIDPLAEREAERAAPAVADLSARYLAEHAIKKRTGKDDESMIRRIVNPELGNRKVVSLTFADIDRLHRKVTKEHGPYQANRLVALLSKMLSLAVRWEMRTDNPARGVERNPEERRYRYLSGDELRRLTEALAAHSSQAAANAVRLLLLTGARRGEVLSATWDQFDLNAGIWIKPSAHTKQKREHRVPISAPARQLLGEMKAAQKNPAPYVFPARGGDGPMMEIKTSWASLCKAAGLRGVRIHDLRHTYASVLASAGLSLPVIGALLGHTQNSTTARYAHLFDDPLRAATERVGAIVAGAGGDVVPLARAGRR